MADLDGDDEFPNDFDGFDFDDIPGLQIPTTSNNPPSHLAIPGVRHVAHSAVASPAPSTGSDSVDEIDPSFLAAVDEIEARAMGEISRGSDSSVRADPGPSETICNSATVLRKHRVSQVCPFRYYGSHLSGFGLAAGRRSIALTPSEGSEEATNIEQPRKRSIRSPDICSTNKKGKKKADPQDEVDVRVILEGYEAELTCPICCDILVGAQVANPCGHTCCGECGYGWLARNKYAPSCATCRSSLYIKKPLLPNFTLDNLVQQHLQSLARTGRPEWQEKGYRYIEWTKRLESWKKQTARATEEKAKEAARLRRRQSHYHPTDDAYVPPWLTHEAEYEEDEEGVLVSRIVARFARRR